MDKPHRRKRRISQPGGWEVAFAASFLRSGTGGGVAVAAGEGGGAPPTAFSQGGSRCCPRYVGLYHGRPWRVVRRGRLLGAWADSASEGAGGPLPGRPH